MSNKRYLEFNSVYRNRNIWPNPGEFEMPISQSGRGTIVDAINPVSNSVPLLSWTSNLLLKTTAVGYTPNIPPSPPVPPTINFIIDNIQNISNTNSPTVIIAKLEVPVGGGSFQQLTNYYIGLVLETDVLPIPQAGVQNPIKRRIVSYNYLYNSTIAGTNYDFAEFIIESSFPDTVIPGYYLSINDPTDVTDPSNPYFFIPSGSVFPNAYIDYILYNESLNQYRKIKSYDETTHLLSLITSDSIIATNSSGPVTGWLVTNNYSLRNNIPVLPVLSGTNPTITGVPTISTIDITPTTSTSKNYYKNYTVRILGTNINRKYNYINNLVDNYPDNISKVIVESTFITPDTQLRIFPPYISAPAVNSLVEILPFSYDGFNPFSYTGSLISQQQMVCYEIELINLILPNETLDTGEGGLIAFYPYVYVEISNVSAPGGHLKDIIYSNNPNANYALFRCPVNDIQPPLKSKFIKLDSDGSVKTVKFKPNDNLYFRVFLQTGQLFKTVKSDLPPPYPINYDIQISAMISMVRL